MTVVVYALCSLLVTSQALSGVRGITNAEFFDQLKDYISDFEVHNGDASSGINYDVTDVIELPGDVIELPGGPDDEIDLVYLFRKIGFTLTEETSALEHYVSDGAIPVKENLLGGCSCQKLNCNCCGSKTFSFKTKSFTLTGCVNIEYLKVNKGFMVTITINDRQVYKKEISLRNPPGLCYNIPGTPGKVCLKFYDVDIHNRKACAKLVGSLNLLVKKFEVSLELGCFSIPIVEEESSLHSAPVMLHEGQDPDKHVLERHVQYLEIKESSPQKGKTELNVEDNWMPDESDAEPDAV